jgi:hypothetical protein
MVGLTRRRFCAGTALAGASLAVAGCDPAGPKPRTLETYTGLAGTSFTVREPGGSVRSLLLHGLRVHAPPLRTGGRQGESFTLIFAAAEPMTLAQATYPVSHPELGEFALFLVPRGRHSAAGLPTYAATYCRL